MEIRENKNEEFVRVMIGKAKQGKSGITKPIKTISLIKTTVEEVFNKIKEMIENENPNN